MSITADDLKTYFSDELGVDTDDLADDTPLFSSGIIDSFALVSLITHIEARCKFRMSPADVNLDNMDSIDRILVFVAKRMAAA
jgi:acyl carrier protein